MRLRVPKLTLGCLIAFVSVFALSFGVLPPGPSFAQGVMVSGYVTESSGLPPSNEVVIQLAPTTGGQPAQTYPGTDGSYSLQVAPGTYDLIITWYSNGSETGMVSGDGTITVTGNMTEDVTLPEIATLDTTVVDSNDVPVQDASVSVGEADNVPGSTQDGTPLTWSYPAQYGGTDTSGQCALTSLLGATVSVEATPPDGSGVTSSATLTSDTTDVTVQLPASVMVSGYVTESSGLPPSNEVVIQLAPTTGGQPAQTYPGTDGSYSLQVAPGTYDLIITWYSNGSETGMVSGDGTITVTGNMTEDVTLPEIATLDTTVVDSNDVPVQDASVSVGEADNVPGSTQDGTPLTWSYPAQYGGTDTSGQCALTSLLGATVSVEATPPDGSGVTSSATLTSDTTDVTVQLPASVMVSGYVTESSGLPPSNEVVIQLAPTTGGQPAQTYPGTDGSYSLQVAPGTYDLIITWYSNGSETGMVSGDGTITVTGNMTEDVTLPEIATLDTTVVDSNDVPVQDASVSVGEADNVPGSTQDGTPLTWSYPAQYGGTDTSGQCALTSLLGATVSVEATPPDGSGVTSSATLTSDTTDVTVQLSDYAVVPSAGTQTGFVVVSSPTGTTLSNVSDSSVPSSELPPGAVALTGALAYDLSVPPGSTETVTLQLPAGSDPTGVIKLENGVPVDISSIATISGDTVTLSLTDGGLGDADGVANGTIVDPLIPIQQVQAPQAISFTSTAPTNAVYGGSLSLSATGGGSGNPVVFSSATPVVCGVSGSTASFSGLGTCTIDADQAGNADYLAAPTATQSFSVSQAPQVITFTSSPSNPAYLGTYTVSATGGGSGNPVIVSVDSSATKVCSVSGSTASFKALGRCVLDANQAGNTDYLVAVQVQQSFSVGKATPVLTWATPAAITYGAKLGGSQLDAKASVAGQFVYNPPAGTVLKAGSDLLSATFTPTDSVHYATTTTAVTLVVNQAKPVAAWATPAAITYPTPLSATQLDATASVPGTFSYSEPFGTVLAAGSYSVTAAFTPTDSVDYQSATLTRTIVVKQSATKTTLSFTTPVIYGSETSEVFQVSVSSPSGAIPPGTVGVYNGTVLLCTATLNSTGNGSCNLSSNSALAVGSHSIAAKYSATTNFAASTSAAQTLTVKH